MGAGYMYLLLSLYVMKFSTDVLLIAPAVMGLIFSISRIWDAVSDPLVGYLSDRTSISLGRRRTWILFSFIPIAIGFYAVFAPPPESGRNRTQLVDGCGNYWILFRDDHFLCASYGLGC